MLRWLNKSIGNRALAIALASCLASVVVAGIGVMALGQQHNVAQAVRLSDERAMLAERLNGAVYRAVMESRGIYAATTTETAKPFAKGLLEALVEVRMLGDSFEKISGGSAAAKALNARITEFVTFRTETARLGTEVAPKAANEQGNNDVNRANRSALNLQIMELLSISREEANRAEGELIANTKALQLKFFASSLGLAALMCLLSAFVVIRAVRRPLAATADALQKVIRNEAVEIPGLNRVDELGTMAKIMAALAENTEQLRKLDASRIREGHDTAARAERVGELQSRVAGVIGAAVEGDFSHRIEARFPDADLQDLADRVDTLLSTFDTGISETQRVLRTLASGQLSARVEGHYVGAFAALKQDTNALAAEFEGTLSRLTQAAGAVRTATSEILAGVTDLAGRTTDQASVVAQTTTQLGAFAASFKQNASRAGEAVQLSRTAEDGAREGGDVLVLASEAMDRIAQSSKRINDIIDLIDEIAFQTNLLALNAAVEAARAGDSGRGFAVVAAEVRSLAQRAAGASNDVKQLIVTAQSDVGSGVQLVEQTSAVFRKIFTSVNDVSRLMDAIAATSQTQASEIGDLTDEVSRIDDMTQQNAALVEETNAAIAVTDQQTMGLEALVSRFEFRAEAVQGNTARRKAA